MLCAGTTRGRTISICSISTCLRSSNAVMVLLCTPFSDHGARRTATSSLSWSEQVSSASQAVFVRSLSSSYRPSSRVYSSSAPKRSSILVAMTPWKRWLVSMKAVRIAQVRISSPRSAASCSRTQVDTSKSSSYSRKTSLKIAQSQSVSNSPWVRVMTHLKSKIVARRISPTTSMAKVDGPCKNRNAKWSRLLSK